MPLTKLTHNYLAYKTSNKRPRGLGLLELEHGPRVEIPAFVGDPASMRV